MEMMQIMQKTPSAPPVPGQTPGKLPGKQPAPEGGEFFRTLLNRQQAAALSKKMAEEGDAALLTGWLLPGLPTETADGVAAAATATAAEKGMADSSVSSLASGHNNVSPEVSGFGAQQQPGVIPAEMTGLNPEEVDLTGGVEQIILAGLGEKGLAPGKTSGRVVPGIAPTGLTTVTGASAPGLPLAVPPLENRAPAKGEAAVATRGLGILESRLAEILRPLQAATGNARSGENNPALSASAGTVGQGELRLDGIVPTPPVSASAPPAIVPVTPAIVTAPPVSAPVTPVVAPVTPAIDSEVLALQRETKSGGVLSAEQPDLATTGDLSAARPFDPSSKLSSAEGASRTQPFASTVSESHILDQVVGRIAVTGKDDISRMSIRLQPEELGNLDIDLTVENGRIKALVVAQNQQVQEVLERHLPRLREALEQQGLKLDQIQVSVNAQAGEGRGFSQQHRQAESQARQWSRSSQPEPMVEREELPSPTISSMGKISLRI